MSLKVCIECGKNLNGRSDKKFCDDGCRNTHHNRLNNIQPSTVRQINSILRKNRKIIRHLLPKTGEVKIPEQSLELMGFNFDYCTNVQLVEDKVVHYCYEFSYCKDKDGIYNMTQAPLKRSS